MLNIDQVRTHQEQRLVPVLDAWNEAKRNLENAIALAEAREREYREVCADVRKKLDALDLVIHMARELRDEIPERRPGNSVEIESTPMLLTSAAKDTEVAETADTPVKAQPGSGDLQRLDRLLRRSSRPLFPAKPQARIASLSILQ